MVSVIRWPAAAIVFGVAASCVAAQEYEVVDLGTLGGQSSSAMGISQNGVVAGYAQQFSSVKHSAIWDASGVLDLGAPEGFVVSEAVALDDFGRVAATGEGSQQSYSAYSWENGSWTPLGVLPGRNESLVKDIDSTGRIVGRSFNLGSSASAGAFIWEAGVLSDLGTLGGGTGAEAINDVGQVVGASRASLQDGGESSRAFVWQSGVMKSLGVLAGEDESQAFGINDLGDVVGSSWHVTIPQFFSAHQATLWSHVNAEPIDLGLTPGPPVCVDQFPFYTANIARAINNCGQVVGQAQCIASGGAKAAFLWRDDQHFNLNDLIPEDSNWDLLSALDINDAGQIVGFGINPDGELHAFRLDPVESSPCTVWTLRVDGERLFWNDQVGASAYDVIQGSLDVLRETSGDFSVATTECLTDELAATAYEGLGEPAPGTGYWLLVRAVGEDAPATYDSGGPGQIASRDPGINASPASCR